MCTTPPSLSDLIHCQGCDSDPLSLGAFEDEYCKISFIK